MYLLLISAINNIVILNSKNNFDSYLKRCMVQYLANHRVSSQKATHLRYMFSWVTVT